MDFKSFTDTATQNQWKLHGIEVFQNGEILHTYGDTANRYPIYSATKTFTSTAAGLAVQEGRFSIEESIYDYLKSEIPSYVPDSQRDSLKKISIKRLLTMSVAGYPFRPEGKDWLSFSLAYPLENVEKSEFAYSNIPAYLVGVAIEKAVGEHLISFLQPRILEPLGILNPVYSNCPAGHFYGASGMQLSVHELSKLGQLYLQNGCYEGKQLLSADWVKEASSIQQMNREGGYGYYIWKYRDGYRISGKWGQRCFVFPHKQLMVTYLCDMEHGSEAVTKAAQDYLF